MATIHSKGNYIKILKRNGIRSGVTLLGQKVSLEHLKTFQLIDMLHEKHLTIE